MTRPPCGPEPMRESNPAAASAELALVLEATTSALLRDERAHGECHRSPLAGSRHEWINATVVAIA